MEKRTISVELDEETIRRLAQLGDPAAVLADLAKAGVERVELHDAQRTQTNESLRLERHGTDVRLRSAAEASSERPEQQAESRARAKESTTRERKATDTDLGSERAESDVVLVGQREANEALVRAALRAQELAEEADAAKKAAEAKEREARAMAEFRELFVGIVGHDLRNPLGAITMSATLLAHNRRLAAEDADIAARILRVAQRMNRLINQLLDLTRARHGGGVMPIEVKSIDLAEVCRHVIAEFHSPIELEVHGDVSGTWDPDRLEEVVSNLVGNAIDYATPGTPVLVTVRGDAEDVVLEVENEGPPIPADVLPFLFEPFRRAQQGETAPARHLGLGLYIANVIVLAHQGTMEARSADGRTTFVIRLPRAPEATSGKAG